MLELESSQSDALVVAHSLVARHLASVADVLGFNDALLVGAAIVLAGLVPALFLAPKPSAGARRASSPTVEALE